MTADDVLALLARECEKAGSQSAWAKAHGLSAPYVSDVLKRRREPGRGILDALGIEKVVTYRKAKPAGSAGDGRV
jgi:DNA-binding transcriptional regulator YdaS (Cro superfamily)